MTNAEARFNNSLRPRKPEGSLGRTAQDGHLDSHTAPELCPEYDGGSLFIREAQAITSPPRSLGYEGGAIFVKTEASNGGPTPRCALWVTAPFKRLQSSRKKGTNRIQEATQGR